MTLCTFARNVSVTVRAQGDTGYMKGKIGVQDGQNRAIELLTSGLRLRNDHLVLHR